MSGAAPVPVYPAPLTEAAFAPFGRVLRHDGRAGRRYVDPATQDIGQGVTPRLWINALAPVTGDIVLRQVERHPHSAQSFLPMGAGRLLTAVCPARLDGSPDIAALKVFVLPPGTGISYRRGVWHHGLVSLDAACDVGVLMATGEAETDTVLHDLDPPRVVRRRDLETGQA